MMIAVSSLAYLQERHGDPIQGVQQGTSASTTVASPAMPMGIARPPQKSSIAMPAKFLEGDSESETPCEGERSQGGDEDLSSRCPPSTRIVCFLWRARHAHPMHVERCSAPHESFTAVVQHDLRCDKQKGYWKYH